MKLDKNNILLPVIHTLDRKQVLENAQVAFDNGADGVMLNNHPSSLVRTMYNKSLNTTKELIDMFVVDIKNNFPGRFVGINDLNNYDTPENIFSHVQNTGVNAVWVDKPFIDGMKQQDSRKEDRGELIKKIQHVTSRKGLYMGGVNFKYVDEKNHLSEEELIALAPTLKSYLDIIVTTGSGTGKAADVEKMKMFASIFGQENMALASGVTLENYRKYQEYAKIFMVATGLQQTTGNHKKDFHYLDGGKIAHLAGQITSHNIAKLATSTMPQQVVSQELASLLTDDNVINIGYRPDNHSLASALSNLYPSSFVLDGVEYASVEAFWMSIKFPPTDPRRELARNMSGVAAKKFGDPMKGAKVVHYGGEDVLIGSEEHHALLKCAIKAKLEQNPDILFDLVHSGHTALVHVTLTPERTLYPDSSTIPAKGFAQIIADLRDELRIKGDSV